jgi:hypothetical protein
LSLINNHLHGEYYYIALPIMSHSQRSSYYPTPSNRSSRSSTYHDQDRKSHSHSTNKRHDSSRSHHDNQRYAGHKSGTYGTCIYPLDESRRYVTDDPTTCRCNCCPHPKSICKSHAEPPHSTDPYYPGRPHDAVPRKPSSSHPSSSSRHGRSRSSKSDSFVIDVVDGTDSALSRKYGRDYPITLSTSASSVSSILAFLAPDKRRAKVVVHWTDGEVETLGEQVPLKELRRYGRYLEVTREKKKRVHWAC